MAYHLSKKNQTLQNLYFLTDSERTFQQHCLCRNQTKRGIDPGSIPEPPGEKMKEKTFCVLLGFFLNLHPRKYFIDYLERGGGQKG